MRRSKQQKLMYYLRTTFYKKVLKDLEEVEEKVCWILARYEEARNSDMFLLMKYWNEANNWNGLFISPYIYRIANAELIIRKRRYIQNTLGLWLPTDDSIIEARSIKEDIMKEWFGLKKAIA